MPKYSLTAVIALTLASGLLGSAPAHADTETPVAGKPVIARFATSNKTFYPNGDTSRNYVRLSGKSYPIVLEDETGEPIDSAAQGWRMTIRNANGQKIAERSGRNPQVSGEAVWKWKGKNQRTGKPVAVGRYTASFTVTNLDTDEKANQKLTISAITDKPVITRFSAKTDTFYPTVRDGFRDGVRFVGKSNNIVRWGRVAAQRWNMTIHNANGQKVAERSGRNPQVAGEAVWEWSGKNQRTGKPVAVGRYTATFTVTNLKTDEKAKRKVTIRATADIVTRRNSSYRYGIDTAARWSSSSCYINSWWPPSSLDLDCWGGYEAVAQYAFTIPAGAHSIVFGVPGERGCCDNGQVQKTGWRDGNRYNVRVRVTNWASYTIDKVVVDWAYPVRR